MSENPDNKHYFGLGEQQKMRSEEDGEPLAIDQRYLVPTQGQLRFVVRAESQLPQGIVKDVRILQQYQWCAEEGAFDWYDIPLVDE